MPITPPFKWRHFPGEGFRCRNASCPCKIFCERLPRIACVHGRQTERAAEIVRLIGYVAGGLPGQRLLARLSIATSDDTILRRVRQKPVPELSVLPISQPRRG